MSPIDVSLAPGFKMIRMILTVCTLGVGWFIMTLSARSWPRRVDDAGMTLRSGKQVSWDDLSDVRRVMVVDQLGRRVTGRLELIFGKTTAKIVPQSLIPGHQVMAAISERLGFEATTG